MPRVIGTQSNYAKTQAKISEQWNAYINANNTTQLLDDWFANQERVVTLLAAQRNNAINSSIRASTALNAIIGMLCKNPEYTTLIALFARVNETIFLFIEDAPNGSKLRFLTLEQIDCPFVKFAGLPLTDDSRFCTLEYATEAQIPQLANIYCLDYLMFKFAAIIKNGGTE